MKGWAARRRGLEHAEGEGARARTGLDDDVRVGPAERAPPPVEGTSHDGAEERAHLGAGEEVVVPPRSGACGVEPRVRVVQRELDDLVVPQGTEAANALGDELGYGTRDEISPKRPRRVGYTPTAITTSADRPSAAPRAGGTATGVRSSSGMGLIHISRATLA